MVSYHIKLKAWYGMAYSFKRQILDQHGQNFYKHNAEAPRNENRNTMNMQSQYLKARDLTSLKPWRLSQTLVPLISDTCRSEVSPPKITKTFCLDVPLWIASTCLDGCSFLDKVVQALLHGTREENREQAC